MTDDRKKVLIERVDRVSSLDDDQKIALIERVLVRVERLDDALGQESYSVTPSVLAALRERAALAYADGERATVNPLVLARLIDEYHYPCPHHPSRPRRR